MPKSNTGSHFKLYSVALAGIPSGVSSQKHNIITTSCPHCSDNQHTWNQASKTICIKSALASAPSLKGGFYTWFWNPLQYTVPWTQTSPKRAYDQVKLFLQSALGCAQHTHKHKYAHVSTGKLNFTDKHNNMHMTSDNETAQLHLYSEHQESASQTTRLLLHYTPCTRFSFQVHAKHRTV